MERHECKHLIGGSDMPVLRARLRAVAQPDCHGSDGKYAVRSLYFDDPWDSALREKQDGVDGREKFRIRYYDGDTSLIHLEKKRKRGGSGTKDKAPLSREEVQTILDGCSEWMRTADRPLIRELYAKMGANGLRPHTVVDYTREAFTFGPGNVRVTLDYDLRTCLGFAGFLDPEGLTIPVWDAPIILEVKWDAFLPDVIRDAVQLPGRRTQAFSKYAACRIYDPPM